MWLHRPKRFIADSVAHSCHSQDTPAISEAGDGARLGNLFTGEGVYHDTFYGEFRGRAAIADMLENHFWRDAEGFKWEMRHPLSDGALGYAEWTFSYTTKMPRNRGTRVVFEGMSRFRIEGGKFASYDEMFDGGVALVQLGFPPDRLAKVMRKWSEAKRALPHAAAHLAR